MAMSETNKQHEIKLMEELRLAIARRDQAYDQFNHAEPQFIEVAIYEYNAATERVNILIKQVKEKEGNQYDKQVNF